MLKRERFEVEYWYLFEEYGLGTTIWSPLCGGLLTGKYNDGVFPADSRAAKGKYNPEFQDLFTEEKKKATCAMLTALGAIAKEMGFSQAQLALAWTLANKNVSVALFGSTKLSQIDDNVKAIKCLDKLTPEILARIEKILNNRPAAPMDMRTLGPGKPRR